MASTSEYREIRHVRIAEPEFLKITNELSASHQREAALRTALEKVVEDWDFFQEVSFSAISDAKAALAGEDKARKWK